MKSVPEKSDASGQNRRFDHRQPSGRWARILRLRSRGEEPRMNHGRSSESSESMSLWATPLRVSRPHPDLEPDADQTTRFDSSSIT